MNKVLTEAEKRGSICAFNRSSNDYALFDISEADVLKQAWMKGEALLHRKGFTWSGVHYKTGRSLEVR